MSLYSSFRIAATVALSLNILDWSNLDPSGRRRQHYGTVPFPRHYEQKNVTNFFTSTSSLDAFVPKQ